MIMIMIMIIIMIMIMIMIMIVIIIVVVKNRMDRNLPNITFRMRSVKGALRW